MKLHLQAIFSKSRLKTDDGSEMSSVCLLVCQPANIGFGIIDLIDIHRSCLVYWLYILDKEAQWFVSEL